MTNVTEDDLKRELLNAVEICISNYSYRPSYFLQMLENYGAVNTAIKLVTTPKLHEGFEKLYFLKRLDLTIEAVILRNPYNQLFTKDVLDFAAKRLKALGYIGE